MSGSRCSDAVSFAAISLWWASLVVAMVAACGRSGSEAKPRVLATLNAGDAEVRIEAKLECQHIAAGPTPNMDWRPAHDACRIDSRPVATRSTKALAFADDGDGSRPQKVIDKADAKRAFEALTADTCGDASRVLWRLHDPIDSAVPDWQIAYPLPAHVIRAVLDTKASSCADALAAAPSTEDWIVARAKSWDACRVFDEEGRSRDALRCVLQTGIGPRSGGFEALGKKYEDGVKSGAMEGDLYAVLLPDPKQDARNWDKFAVRDALMRAPSIDRKRASIAQSIAYCAKAGSKTKCAEWRVYANWFLVAEMHDATLCDTGLSEIEALLKKPEREAAAQALQIVPQLCGCGTTTQRLAAIMREGLVRPTVDEMTLPSDDYTTYDGIDGECKDETVATAVVTGGGQCMPGCTSFPRFAGSWLARHCDAHGVDAAKKALAGRPSRDPRTDSIVDGALRVLGACSKADFEKELARVPPGAKPDRVKALLEK